MTIVFAIALFSFLIFIHEFGHFITAKLSGVQVNEFAMFMGPAIWKKQVGETLYSIRCIPIGGYCAMEGEDQDTDNPRSFQKAAWWKRLLILVAGSAMNFLSGLLILLCLYLPSEQFIVPVVAQIEPGCALAGEQGIQVGDRFLSVDGEKIYVQSDFSMLLSLNGGEVHDLVLDRNGETVVLDDFRMEKREFDNGDGTTSLRYGFSFGIEEASLGSKLSFVWNNALDTVRMVRLSLKMLFNGQAGLSDMAGPVGIVSQMNEIAEDSETTGMAIMNLLSVGSFLAINLAVMNLLPIPALDGGRVVALLITTAVEAVTKKKIDPKYEGYIHGAGMLLLLALMAIIMFKDIFVLFRG